MAANGAVAVDQGRPAWQDDSDQKECSHCKRAFTMTNRRHHCRGCGKLFDDRCSSKRIAMPANFGYGDKPQRACDSCFLYLMQLQYDNADVKPEKPDYDKVENEMLQKAEGLLAIPESEWKVASKADGIEVAICRFTDSPLYGVRTQFTIDASMDVFSQVYSDTELWMQINQDLKLRVIEDVDAERTVMTSHSHVPVIDDRDCVFLTIKRKGYLTGATEEGKSAISVVATSIDHPLFPKHKGIVRARLNVSVTTIEAMETEDGSKVQKIRFKSIVHADPRGLLPPTVVNFMVGRAGSNLAGLVKIIKEKEASKAT